MTFLSKLSALIDSLFFEDEWHIGIIQKGIDQIFSPSFFEEVDILPNPYMSFLADPFILSEQPLQLIAEKYNYFKRKGHLVTIDNQSIHDFINEKYHLSFPFVFHDENKKFIIPESIEANAVSIYSFETHKRTKILDASILDPFIFTDNNHYYLIGNDSYSNKIKLFESAELLSGWAEALSWEIKGDSLYERSAGGIFDMKGTKIRPTQIMQDGNYGYGINFNRLSINTTGKILHQSFIKKIDVHDLSIKKAIGFHTVNGTLKNTVIDVKTKKFILFNICFKAIRRLTLKIMTIRFN